MRKVDDLVSTIPIQESMCSLKDDHMLLHFEIAMKQFSEFVSRQF
jgi:hypothetical protein